MIISKQYIIENDQQITIAETGCISRRVWSNQTFRFFDMRPNLGVRNGRSHHVPKRSHSSPIGDEWGHWERLGTRWGHWGRIGSGGADIHVSFLHTCVRYLMFEAMGISAEDLIGHTSPSEAWIIDSTVRKIESK